MTHIGVACNCHPVFEQFCVIEVGKNVFPLPPKAHEHTHVPKLNISQDMQDDWPFVNTPPAVEFSLPSKTCK